MQTDNLDDAETEALRRRLINQLEAAYFSGIGAAIIEITDVEQADKEELLRLARQWGVK